MKKCTYIQNVWLKLFLCEIVTLISCENVTCIIFSTYKKLKHFLFKSQFELLDSTQERYLRREICYAKNYVK